MMTKKTVSLVFTFASIMTTSFSMYSTLPYRISDHKTQQNILNFEIITFQRLKTMSKCIDKISENTNFSQEEVDARNLWNEQFHGIYKDFFRIFYQCDIDLTKLSYHQLYLFYAKEVPMILAEKK